MKNLKTDSEESIINFENDTWKTVFVQQVSSGRFWKNLLKDDFNQRFFLDREDAIYICKKAQADTYEKIIKDLKGKVDKEIIDKLKQDVEDLWKKDDSMLGIDIYL